MVLVRVVERPDEVVCAGSRAWLRLRPGDPLVVEASRATEQGWRRVDDDLHALLRAGLRLVVTDLDAARQVADAACRLAGVAPRDPDPARRLVRAAYPLLAGVAGLPAPTVPPRLPAWMAPAFRERSPRDAARWLLGRRVTRPVVRALCDLLAEDPADLFRLSVVCGAAPRLEPDHVATLLSVPRPGAATVSALTPSEVSGVAGLVEGDRRRVVRWLVAGLGGARDRERLRFVAGRRRPDGPGLAAADDWAELALRVATGGGAC